LAAAAALRCTFTVGAADAVVEVTGVAVVAADAVVEVTGVAVVAGDAADAVAAVVAVEVFFAF
jgi:hypothetical protein